MTRKDVATLKQLLRACENDYPAKTFCGFDSDNRPCVILLYCGLGGCDFDWFHFSTMDAAIQAFRRVDKLLKEIDEMIAEKTDCPFDRVDENEINANIAKIFDTHKKLCLHEFLSKK